MFVASNPQVGALLLQVVGLRSARILTIPLSRTVRGESRFGAAGGVAPSRGTGPRHAAPTSVSEVHTDFRAMICRRSLTRRSESQ
jgi:hypothetical protein